MDIKYKVTKLKDNSTPGYFPVIQAGYYDELKELCEYIGVEFIPKKNASEIVKAQIVGKKIAWENKETTPNKIPNVIGMTFRDALPLLENLQMEVDYEGIGRVVKQSIIAGTNVEAGRKIKVWLKQ